jgi:hypothetical protein
VEIKLIQKIYTYYQIPKRYYLSSIISIDIHTTPQRLKKKDKNEEIFVIG